MALKSIFKNLREGNLEFVLEDKEDQLRNLKSSEELEQILGLCSHFIYNVGTVEKAQLSAMTKIVTLSISASSVDFHTANVFKSLCYILILGVKKGLDVEMTLSLVKEIENILNINEIMYINYSDSLRKIYSTLWNLSLQKGLSASDSLILQSYALEFLCLVGENLSEVCDNCQRAGKVAEHLSCPTETIEAMYTKILSSVIVYLKRKPNVHSSSVIILNLALIEYARFLFKNKNCSKFSKAFKPMASHLEFVCDPKIVLSFKMSMKLVEAGVAFVLEQCTKELITKLLNGCNIISKSSLPANTILVDSLLFVHQLFSDTNKSNKLDSLSDSIFTCLAERVSPDDNLSKESFLKILEVFGNHLNCFVSLNLSYENAKEELLSKAVKPLSLLRILAPKVEKSRGDTHVYNIGINCCNLGVIAFKANKSSIAAEFLDVGVQYLNHNYIMCDKTQKSNVLKIMKKKAILLKDSLRYSGQYKEAAVKTVSFVVQNILPESDIIPTWIKCKRDAHRANTSSLKTHCIKDIYSEVKSDLTTTSRPQLVIEELLLQEIKELEQLCHDTGEEQLVCARALVVSDQLHYSLEGSLALTKTFWLHSDLVSEEETALKIISDLLLRLEKLSMQNKCKFSFYLEYKSRALFWFYLCNLQIIQEKAEAEVEEKQKCDEPLTAQSTDLGEEAQPNDACSIRPSTSVATFSTQEAAFDYLHQALHNWEQVVKEKDVLHPSLACDNLLSIGYIFKLSGLLPDCIKAFGLLLALADMHDLRIFWIKGVIELIEIVPELVPPNVAQRLQTFFISEESDGICKLTESSKLASLTALAYYYYRTGEFIIGAEILLDCLCNPIMEKRTSSATELQIAVYFAASHYAFLPLSVLPSELRPKEPCLFLAIAATRKAIGLANVLADHSCYQENICWRHKVAWLHHITNLWLGRLCHITAQPRLARAYLRQALTLAEKLALPLRTVELLCTLAEIDLQCDQLDDCRVKIDSLDKLLQVHSPPETNKDDLKATERSTNPCLKEKQVKRKLRDGNSAQGFVPIFIDNDSFVSEKLREGEETSEFSLKIPSLELGNRVVIGDARRIPHLATINHSNSQCPLSPSVGFREENFVVRTVVCPVGILDCPVCVAPELHAAAIRAKVTMGVIHAHRSNFKGARQCFNRAEEDILKLSKSSKEIESKLTSILATGFPPDQEGVKGSETFVQSHLSLAKLCLFFYWNEVLCMEKTNWDEMEARVSAVLTEVSNLSPFILALNHPLVLQLILQGEAVSRTVRKRLENQDDDDDPVCDASPILKPTTQNANQTSSAFKTPARSTLKKHSKNLLTSKSHTPMTPFRIFTDDDDNTSSGEKNASDASTETHQERSVKNLAFSFGKLALDGNNQNNKHSPKFSPLSSLNSSPFSQVLKLASRKNVGKNADTSANSGRSSRLVTSTRKMNSKLRSEKVPSVGNKMKMISRKVPSKLEDDEELVKDDSPLINSNVNLGIYVKTAGSTSTSRNSGNSEVKSYGGRSTRATSLSASASTDTAQSGKLMETRRQRNLRRL